MYILSLWFLLRGTPSVFLVVLRLLEASNCSGGFATVVAYYFHHRQFKFRTNILCLWTEHCGFLMFNHVSHSWYDGNHLTSEWSWSIVLITLYHNALLSCAIAFHMHLKLITILWMRLYWYTSCVSRGVMRCKRSHSICIVMHSWKSSYNYIILVDVELKGYMS